ncbi:MAG: glycoside hydrolase family 88 protein, partial [Propionibacteriaceae bacterium]|nr:glycoside hydrolase family 88 protein [Propionibacteriaceae bacterium]
TPFAMYPATPDEWHGVLIELGADTTFGHAAVSTSSSASHTTFHITWPDGATTPLRLHQPPKGNAMPLSPAVENALVTLEQLDEQFGTQYPDDCTVDGVYPLRVAAFGEPEGGNTEWTTGFVPGMFWVAGDLTGDQQWFDAGRRHLPSFIDRIERKVHVNHHDVGFLYSLSCVPAWRHDKNEQARDAALAAADELMSRVLPKVGIIQSWGDLDDPAQAGRAIIDSLMNMPLLYWATEVTGDESYAVAARRHASLLGKSIVRDDDTTHHTFHWDPETGVPVRGTTAQGHSDTSTWARGQAWGVYGFALNYLHTGDPELLAVAERCARRFLDLLPEDSVPFWDMIFTDGSDEPRDSSAGAIAVCGLNDLAAITGKTEYQEAADRILDSLEANYATTAEGPENCLLLHGVYAKHGGRGIDEGNLWGDYYYMEALQRRQDPTWLSYSHPTA